MRDWSGCLRNLSEGKQPPQSGYMTLLRGGWRGALAARQHRIELLLAGHQGRELRLKLFQPQDPVNAQLFCSLGTGSEFGSGPLFLGQVALWNEKRLLVL